MDPNVVVFWIAAHQDDWQLFHGNQAHGDMQGARTVFIYTTAGDAGLPAGYWQAREAGAIASVLQAVPPQDLSPYAASTPPYLIKASQQFNGHFVARYTCGNTTSYFLRLPSGNWGIGAGSDGYPSNQMTCLWKLQQGQIDTITAVDQSTTYVGWEDLRATIKAILLFEGQGAQLNPWINTSDFDAGISPDDHFDHYATGLLTDDPYFAHNYNRALWQGYSIRDRPENLSDDENNKKWLVLVPYGQVFLLYASLVGVQSASSFEPEQMILQDTPGWNRRAYFRSILAS